MRKTLVRDILQRSHGIYGAVGTKSTKISDLYGELTFDQRQMKTRLPKPAFQKLMSTIENGSPLDSATAKQVANAVKEWAIEKGATHFCHWFQPQTGVTAEKHDAFLTLDESKKPVETFSLSQLIQSEPDASSFPSGGMRSTFEARGYTAWDPSSPIFIMESGGGRTLCIPSAFVSYHGDALDHKTGLMRSIEALSKGSLELLALLGETRWRNVLATLGTEQEYFLVDRAFFVARPDLVMCGRTLLGARPPKGQQLEDHYFGSIPARVQAFMVDMERELFRLGVPVKTRHNEVAPNQFETAPIFEECNVASDHNQLTMEIIKRVAKRHHFEALLHEKPFAGVNGSGKHCNWSLSVGNQNLLDPGKTPEQNVRFLAFLLGVMRGVQKHAGLLRAGIASPGNDHRLGANEAPPAIISVFLGDQLRSILEQMERGAASEARASDAVLKLGVNRLSEVAKDHTDRNRTSPFAFTGNKFEFRAVGASASPAFPVTLLNAAVADGLKELSSALRDAGVQPGKGKDKQDAIWKVLRAFATKTKSIRFEGNNYSDDWVKEAERRGLPHLRKTPEALAELIASGSRSMLADLGVFSESEIVSRHHVRVEHYVKTMHIEAETLCLLVDTYVLPAANRYYTELVQSIQLAKSVGLPAPLQDIASKTAQWIQEIIAKRKLLEQLTRQTEAESQDETRAKIFSTKGSALMEELRGLSDQLEATVADDLWPLPKYREMLFVS